MDKKYYDVGNGTLSKLVIEKAGDIEGIVFDEIKTLFKNPTLIVSTWSVANKQDASITEKDVREGLQNIEAIWDHLYHKEQARLLQLFIEKIRVTTEGVHIDIRTNGMNSLVLDLKAAAHNLSEKSA